MIPDTIPLIVGEMREAIAIADSECLGVMGVHRARDWADRLAALGDVEREGSELARAFRNLAIGYKTLDFQQEQGMDYENARAYAESAINQFERTFLESRAMKESKP